MKSLKRCIASLFVVVALAIGVVPVVASPAYAADDHSGWQSVGRLFDMWGEDDENGMAIIEYDSFDWESSRYTGNYYLTADLSMDRPLVVQSGTEITICLHGHDIKVPGSNSAKYVFYVEENAILNLEACGSGGSVRNINSDCNAAIFNAGELNISGGNIGSMHAGIQTENGTVRISGGNIDAGTIAVDMTGGQLVVSGEAGITGPETGIRAQGGRLDIAGGTIRGTGFAGSQGISMTSSATANISNGEVEGVGYGLQAEGNCSLNFTGGEIRAIGSNPVGIYSTNSDITIAGGNMSMPITVGQIDAANGEVSITGGYFSHSPGAYLAGTHKVVDSGYSSYPYAVIEKDKFTVTFTNGLGKVLKKQSVYEGLSATAPSKPTRSGYAFQGWDKGFSNVTSNLTVNARWKQTEWKDLPAVKIAKPQPAKKAVTVKWKKISKKNLKKIKKVQIQYSRDKSFKTGVKTKYASAKKTSLKIKGLKAKKTYYVKIRAYTKSGGKTHVSKWSSVKKFKTK